MYINKELPRKEKGRVEDEEVILIKLYKVSKSISIRSSSFIDKKIDNLLKYMKFIKLPIQIRIFWSQSYYQSFQLRGEQDSDFWKEVAIILVDNKHNIETSWNRYLINIFQEGPLYKLFFITINNQGQVIIGSNKKMVATYMVGELKVLV